MTLSELRRIREQIHTAFYFSFDSLNGEQRLTFSNLLSEIDSKIAALQEF
jgi:hypothetical protein